MAFANRNKRKLYIVVANIFYQLTDNIKLNIFYGFENMENQAYCITILPGIFVWKSANGAF